MAGRQLLTLIYIIKDGKLLLGLKKRGFGMGRYNGFGGKLEPGETIEESAQREIFEEAGINVLDLCKAGILDFDIPASKPPEIQVHVFKGSRFSGQVTESEEMRPEWFDLDKIPYKKMWADDPYWFPLMMAGKKFKAYFAFDTLDKVIAHKIEEVAELND
ncbi:MAG: DNA mismatch repair protein MutT [Parcubacteria group bacterium]|nr:MAG: DNA mismatch repair protein MutT [Parcubacteria group bacterium]